MLKVMLQNINLALTVGGGLEAGAGKKETFEVAYKFPSNKKFETQKSNFFSTNRKSKNKNKLK